MSRHRIPPTGGLPPLCEWCEITEADDAGRRWKQRHKVPGAPPPCEASQIANVRYHRARRGLPLDAPARYEGWQECATPSCSKLAVKNSDICRDCIRTRSHTSNETFSVNANVLGSYTDNSGRPRGIDCLTRSETLAARSRTAASPVA